MKNCPIKMWSRADYQVESGYGILCDGPECAWCVMFEGKSTCAFALMATRLANIQVKLGRRSGR